MKKEEITNKTTNKTIETKLSQQNIHPIQSNNIHIIWPPFTRMTPSQLLRIETTYRNKYAARYPSTYPLQIAQIEQH